MFHVIFNKMQNRITCFIAVKVGCEWSFRKSQPDVNVWNDFIRCLGSCFMFNDTVSSTNSAKIQTYMIWVLLNCDYFWICYKHGYLIWSLFGIIGLLIQLKHLYRVDYIQGIIVGYKDVITYFLPLKLFLLPFTPQLPPSPLTGSSPWLLLHLWLNRYACFSPVFHSRLISSFLFSSFPWEFTSMPVTSPTMCCYTENHPVYIYNPSLSLCSWGWQFSVVVKTPWV